MQIKCKKFLRKLNIHILSCFGRYIISTYVNMYVKYKKLNLSEYKYMYVR